MVFQYWIQAGAGFAVGFFVISLVLEELYTRLIIYLEKKKRERSRGKRG